MKIAENTTVKIDFSITDLDGNIIESTAESGAAVYMHGMEMMPKAVEDAMLGKEAGDSINLTLLPENGFGKRDNSLIRELPKSEFEGLGEVKIGDEFQSHDDDGNHIFVTVTEIKEDTIIIDANHPFADKTLVFNIDVKDVRESTDNDYKKFHDHEGSGCCCTEDMQDMTSCDSHGSCSGCKA